MAVVAGVDPMGEFTPAELYQMSKTKLSMDWDHTAKLEARIYNLLAPKDKQLEPDDFHPFRTAEKKKKRSKQSILADLRHMMIGS